MPDGSDNGHNPELEPPPPTFSQRVLMYAMIAALVLIFIYLVCLTEHR